MNRRSLLASAVGLLGMKAVPRPRMESPMDFSYRLLPIRFKSKFFEAKLVAAYPPTDIKIAQAMKNLKENVMDVWEDRHAEPEYRVHNPQNS